MNTRMNRRRALKAIGLAGACLAATATPFSALAEESFSHTEPLMGTFVTLTVSGCGQTRAQEAMGRAFETMRGIIPVFDRHDPSSPVSRLNATGTTEALPQLARLLDEARAVAALTGGRFNPTVTPLVQLMRDTAGRPEKADLAAALELVDLSSVRTDGSAIRLGKSGMGLTLDGIAKGRVADLASETLTRCGAANHLVDAGGDVLARGGKASGVPWRVGVRNPDGGVHLGVAALRSGALATSGGYEQPLGSANHIVDPATGRSPQFLRSASVVAPSVQEADALATALSLMSAREALTLVESLPGRECLLLAGTEVITSSGWS